MTLEELIYQKLNGDVALAPLLATYAGNPAVFEFLAPEDSAEGWIGPQTPRVEFIVTREEDSERRISGQASVFIVHRDTSNATAAQIESEIRRILDGVTFRPDEGTITLQWRSLEQFEDDPEYRGLELQFDMIAWPVGTTYSPDPVQALRDWSIAKWANLQVDPATWSPTDANPALYWRMASIDAIEMMSWGAWITGRFQGHILANSPSVRIEWIRRVTEGAALDRRVRMSDGSKVFIQSIGADSESDPLRSGQIRISARFGILTPAIAQTPVNVANVSGATIGSVK